jgi:CRP-like cAMP-binding protein
MADVGDLTGIPLFQSLSAAELEELAGWFDIQSVGEGARLLGEGAAGYSFYVLVEGSAVVTSDGVELATYAPGDFFGEMAIIGSGRRTATVTATSPSRALVMFGSDFRRLQQAHPAIADHIERAARQRQQELLDLHSPGEAT